MVANLTLVAVMIVLTAFAIEALRCARRYRRGAGSPRAIARTPAPIPLSPPPASVPLPENAAAIVERIECLLAEAAPFLGRATGVDGGDAFALRETGRRYLPDTLDAYRALPPALRDAETALLVDQLLTLESAARAHLAAVVANEDAVAAFKANADFLAARFPRARCAYVRSRAVADFERGSHARDQTV